MKAKKLQSNVHYTAQTLTDRKCRGCVWYEGINSCELVESSPLAIIDSGSCILHKSRPATKATPYKLAGSAIAIDPELTTDENEELYQRVYERVLADTGDTVKAILAGRGALRRKYQGLAVKQAPEGMTVAGWAIMFGDSVMKDSANTYFSAKDTEFLLDYYQSAPLFMEHGFNAQYGLMPIGQRVKTQRFEHGIWLEHKLDTSHPLYAKTCGDVNAGKYSYSSDSIEHLVLNGLKPEDGKLSYWALAGCSLVPNPAEIGLGEVIAVDE